MPKTTRYDLTAWIAEQLTAGELLGLLSEDEFNMVAKKATDLLGSPEEWV
jgi:hypothetical protein